MSLAFSTENGSPVYLLDQMQYVRPESINDYQKSKDIKYDFNNII